jgi:hypothetical protein
MQEKGDIAIAERRLGRPHPPDGALGERVIVEVLTGNLTINAPTNPRTGAMLTFAFIQDATGGRTITWNAVFKKAADGGWAFSSNSPPG